MLEIPLEIPDDLWNQIVSINGEVNQRVKYARDEDQFGKREHWAVPNEHQPQGDCEDKALLKWNKLLEAGIPNHAFSMGYCMTEPIRHTNGQWKRGAHAVLMLDCDLGTLILDNRFDYVEQYQSIRDERNYLFMYRSQPGKPLSDPWESIVKG